MSHIWTVTQEGKELGTVEAVSRKGACHAAFEKFGIEQPKRSAISVEILHRDFVRHRSGLHIGIDPGGQDYNGEVVCSFNPALAEPDSGKTLEDCRMRFDMPPFVAFPDWKK
jgi:hypothetical protein